MGNKLQIYTVFFFENLYRSVNQSNPRKYLDTEQLESVLSSEAADQNEGLLTVDEYFNAIREMKLNKSPGLEGLTLEFYLKFWTKIGHMVIQSLNDSFQNGNLSFTKTGGIFINFQKRGTLKT